MSVIAGSLVLLLVTFVLFNDSCRHAATAWLQAQQLSLAHVNRFMDATPALYLDLILGRALSYC